MRYVITFFIFAVLALTVGTGIFVVEQRQYAIVFAMGEVKNVIEEPGIYFKMPTPFQNVLYLDRRSLSSEDVLPEPFVTSDKVNVAVTPYIKWHIADPRQFYVSFGGDEKAATARLLQMAKLAMGDAIGSRTFREVLNGDREKLNAEVKKQMVGESSQVGVELVDARLKRVEYGDQVNSAVFERMRSDKTRVASELRALGEAESEKIRADADKQKAVILAEASRDAEKIKGEGDAKAARIYGQAFSKNPGFYRFYRSLQAFRESFKNKKDILVVDSSSDFFRYMKPPKGAK